jgi:hypothetical protein
VRPSWKWKRHESGTLRKGGSGDLSTNKSKDEASSYCTSESKDEIPFLQQKKAGITDPPGSECKDEAPSCKWKQGWDTLPLTSKSRDEAPSYKWKRDEIPSLQLIKARMHPLTSESKDEIPSLQQIKAGMRHPLTVQVKARMRAEMRDPPASEGKRYPPLKGMRDPPASESQGWNSPSSNKKKQGWGTLNESKDTRPSCNIECWNYIVLVVLNIHEMFCTFQGVGAKYCIQII